MRRIYLYSVSSFIFFCFLFGTCPKIMAYDAPTSLPFTYAGYTFTDYIADNGGNIMFYNSSGSPPYSFSCAHGPDYGLPENIYHGWGIASPALLYYYGCTDFKNCSTVNIYTDSNSHCFGGVYFNSQDIYSYPRSNNELVFQANPYAFPALLTVNLSPAGGGSVGSSPTGINCPSGNCQTSFSGNVQLTATAASNWAFGVWDDGTAITENPHTFNVSGNQTIYAKFFKTFTNAVGNFKASIGSTIETGECVPYVRYEGDIPIYGDAHTWYQQATEVNYAINSSVPRVGSVIVFAIQGGMTSGHVGIVTAISGSNITIRDQNWNNDGKVAEHTVDIGNYTITGYIYYTP